ncbi:SDR family NAD(P)-dependent oxidoreductase [Nocardia sp. NPDC052112]|uniref:SDR family NAD(P)-dependent oxidoreductase n=1 Tax=Nocardia sp. NPDC052112 TaxID=3155646 RepID=UPI003447745B
MSIGDFEDRYGPVALVTGASSGIGKAFAEVLAAMGLDLVLVARRLDRLEESAAKLSQEHGVQVRALQIDLSAPTATQQMLDATGALDVGLVVSNAGFGMKGAHVDNDPQAMADMLMVNCHVPMQLAHGFIPRLRRRGHGGLIFTSSVEAFMGCPYSAAYSASKALVKALGEGLWAELEPEGIDVLTLCPGATESEAAANQGIDTSALPEVMSAEEVARLTIENLPDGPVFVSSDYYRATFETLLSMPRRDALMAMAGQMKR